MQESSEYDSEYDDEDGESSVNSEVDGVPWYLYDGEANAQDGIKVDISNLEELQKLKRSRPSPCSDAWVCILFKVANAEWFEMRGRKGRVTIDQLCGNPVLFIGTEFKLNDHDSKMTSNIDDEILQARNRRFSRKELRSKKKKKRRHEALNRGRTCGALVHDGAADLGYRTL